MPLWAKSRIVVLGNRESRDCSKSDCFAPVLWFDSLRFLVSLSTQHRWPLTQGDCKNAFCQGILLPEETTIVRPPSGDPDASKDEYWLLLKTLYGLCRSPHHWYEKIRSHPQFARPLPVHRFHTRSKRSLWIAVTQTSFTGDICG